ncbi:DNA cytosine methyltransferase [Solilutibacter silvestris]|uniref:DNA cytosine methyltransferase n=1 Tax=Solilutibacter silvestris TaxID=1645665 RepID=UPI003D3335E0
MADGSRDLFNLPRRKLVSALLPDEIGVDLFAGGGGASEAMKEGLGIEPALAYNHDEWAIGMHAANHPMTSHHREDIWHADPRVDVAGSPVGWFHASPDCTHFSQAKGGQPRNGKIRALSWVVLKWVGKLLRADELNGTNTAPRCISMENVRQILTWGPLIAKRDKATGRVIKMDGTVAAKGERVPVQNQQLVPDKRHAGRMWNQFVEALRAFGYVVEWRKLVASDFGAGTSRERLFLIARRDGQPIVWPEPTHRESPVSAAESIDFSDLGRSIFDRPRPLAPATLRRIAKGVVKHVLQAKEPFFLTEFANAGNGGRTWSAMEPLRTQCAGVKGGHFAMVAPTLVQTGYGERAGQSPRSLDIKAPLGTIVAGGVKHALVSAFLEQACGGYYTGAGKDLREPNPTICAQGSMQRLVSADLAQLSPEQEAGALRVAAFLISYYGNGDALSLHDPLDTVTTRDRLALVTVYVRGAPYVIVDIKLRMLKPVELFRAQGFPHDYIIDRTADGRRISNTHAVRMVGNSVSPPPLAALIRANVAAPATLH